MDTGIQGYIDTGIQGYRDTGIQGVQMNQGNREYTWSRDTGSKHMRYIGSTQIIDTWSIQSIDTGSKKNRDKRST